MRFFKNSERFQQLFLALTLVVVGFGSLVAKSDPILLNDQGEKENLGNLASEIFTDPIYNTIYKYELQKFMHELSMNSEQVKERTIKFSEMAKKPFLSGEDRAEFLHGIGFLSDKEYLDYYTSFNKLIQKYTHHNMNANSWSTIADMVFAKQMEKMKEEKSVKLLMANLNPECEKCVWDYHSCMLGYTYNITLTTYYITQTTKVWDFTGTTLNQEYTYTNIIYSSHGVTLYSTHTTTQCFGMLQNCFASCRN